MHLVFRQAAPAAESVRWDVRGFLQRELMGSLLNKLTSGPPRCAALQPGVVTHFGYGQMRRPSRSPAGTGLVALALLYAAQVHGQTAELFTPVDGGPTEFVTLPEGTQRSRLTRVDLGRLGRVREIAAALPSTQDRSESSLEKGSETAPASGGSLHLNLFDDVSVTAIVEWTEPTFSGGYSLSGSLPRRPAGLDDASGERKPGRRFGGGRGADVPHPFRRSGSVVH